MSQSEELAAVLSRIPAKIGETKNELKKRIFGQDDLIDEMLVALLARGHCLLIGCRIGENPPDQHPGANRGTQVQPGTIHPGHDAQ